MSQKIISRFCLILLASQIFLFSCEKKKEDINVTGNPKVYGILSAIKEHKKLLNGTDSIILNDQIAQALFYANPDVLTIFTDAGTIKLNDSILLKDVNNQYLKVTTSFYLENKINWIVAGSADIPPFSYSDTLYFPTYFGNIPSSVDKNLGLNILLDSTTVKGADSVRIYIDDGGNNTISKTYAANAGSIQISSSELSALNLVNDYNAYLGIYPYKGKIKAVSGKGFYFIRENRVGQSINIY